MIHDKFTLQQGSPHDISYSAYEAIGPPTSPKEAIVDDNPLYSDTGPVTLAEANMYECVS